MSLKLSVIGAGYLGAVHATALASVGFEVIAVDTDQNRVAQLNKGVAPFFEPNFDEMLEDEMRSGRLLFTADVSAIKDADLHFVCVGTPQSATSGAADLSYLNSAIDNLLKFAKSGSLIVGKSTVPVGTASALLNKIQAERPDLDLAWNPEFLRESFAVEDTLNPSRIVVGVTNPRSEARLREVFAFNIEAGTPWLTTDLATAELIKVAANSFLATKISFINAMAEICEVAGGDVTVLAKAIGLDPRIGDKFLGAGIGFGGGCLPKDIRAFMARTKELGIEDALAFLEDIDLINQRARTRFVARTIAELGGELVGKKIAVLGAAFKPESDDLRDSPALDISAALAASGGNLWVHDPKSFQRPETLSALKATYPKINFTNNLNEALENAEMTLHLTEWAQYRALDPAEIKSLVAKPVIFDGRNKLDQSAYLAAGWKFLSVGRPDQKSA
jgi:UDPglucose 6-dehydrogenase